MFRATKIWICLQFGEKAAAGFRLSGWQWRGFSNNQIYNLYLYNNYSIIILYIYFCVYILQFQALADIILQELKACEQKMWA